MGFFKYTTDWDYETSEDTTISVVWSVSYGTIVFRNRVSPDEVLRVRYRCAALGLSKGLPVGLSESTYDNWSGGSALYSDRYFSPGFHLPCAGFMLGMGGAIGFTDNEANGLNATIAIFGMAPMFAGVKMYGASRASLPGAGFSFGLATFSVVE